MPADSAIPATTPAGQAWQRLWSSGVIDSFGAEIAHAELERPLARHWIDWMGRLPAPCRLLDVGTGNGALPRWLMHACTDPGIECDAVDIVAVQPGWVEQLAPSERHRWRFHPGVSANDLPFPANQFDVVLSQYGLEYAGWARSVPEVLRVLKPGGQLALVMHHASSRPARLAMEEIEHARWLSDSGWLAAATGMAQALSLLRDDAGRRALATEARWTNVRQAFDRLQQDLQERSLTSLCPDLLQDAQRWATQAFRLSADQGEAAGGQAMLQTQTLISDTAVRLQDLLAHALDERQFQALTRQLLEHGLLLQHAQPLHDRGHLMGWWLLAQRPA